MNKQSAVPLILLPCLLITTSTGWAQAQTAPSPTAKAATVELETRKGQSETYTSDTPDIVRETQLGVSQRGYSGFIWWIPFEFWEMSGVERGIAKEQMDKAFSGLREYTVVAVFAAKVSALGGFDFVPAADLEKNILIPDAEGKEYPAVKEPSQDAKNLAAMMKPFLSAALGKAGENLQMLFFPGKDSKQVLIADATRKGQFSVVVKDILGVPEAVYLWRLPLTSVAPPKYCPVGKERVNLNWDYCPWHGVPLNNPTH
jgi:hypothetical protein